MEDQREFVEHLQIGKQIGKLLDMPKRPQAQKHICCLEYEKSGNLVPSFEKFENYHKDAHTNSAQNGCDTFPNELMRFHFEAKPIWDTIQIHYENAVNF